MVAVDRFKYSPALGSYPLGLVAALMWAYIDTAVTNVTALRGTTKPDQTASQELKAEYDTLAWKHRIGFAHLGAATLITAAAAVLTVIPAWLQIKAELEITPQQRKEILLDERRKASLGVAPKNTTAGGQPTSATSTTLPASMSNTRASASEKK